MTKKHFEALARILFEHHADQPLVEAIADFCATMNPRFDWARFTTACTEDPREAKRRPALAVPTS